MIEKIEQIDLPNGCVGRIGIDYDIEPPIDVVKIAYLSRSRYVLGNEPMSPDRLDELYADIRSGAIIGLPVYAYVHGDVALSCKPFPCPWDSGQSGAVYIDPDLVGYMSRDDVLKMLRGAVDEFAAYLRGECYWFEVVDKDGEVVDSCGGFIGNESINYIKSLMFDAANAMSEA